MNLRRVSEMKVKTSEAKDQVLSYLVANCIYKPDEFVISRGRVFVYGYRYQPLHAANYFDPSSNWAQGGPIIEREKLGVWWATHYVDDEGVEYGNHWYAEPGCTDDNADKPYRVATGPTPLIAAMRCYVVNKLGDEVEVPNEMAS
jgi:hypothetical protein